MLASKAMEENVFLPLVEGCETQFVYEQKTLIPKFNKFLVLLGVEVVGSENSKEFFLFIVYYQFPVPQPHTEAKFCLSLSNNK